MEIWTYVITNDDGSAPNYEAPATTLAICKPRIRANAKEGDVVLAFCGATLNRQRPHSVCWAGVISEKMRLGDYWNDKRFACKKPSRSDVSDNIYRPSTGGKLVQVKNKPHGHDQIKRDKSGKNVLVFGKRWHFGNNGPTLPEKFGLRMLLNARRGHRRRQIRNEEWRKLRRWLNSQRQVPLSEGSYNCRRTRKRRDTCGPIC